MKVLLSCVVRLFPVPCGLPGRVYGYFYSPNIHPSQEYQRRLDSFIQLAEAVDLPLIEKFRVSRLRRAAWREQVSPLLSDATRANGADVSSASLMLLLPRF